MRASPPPPYRVQWRQLTPTTTFHPWTDINHCMHPPDFLYEPIRDTASWFVCLECGSRWEPMLAEDQPTTAEPPPLVHRLPDHIERYRVTVRAAMQQTIREQFLQEMEAGRTHNQAIDRLVQQATGAEQIAAVMAFSRTLFHD